jgi:hypothetical protein
MTPDEIGSWLNQVPKTSTLVEDDMEKQDRQTEE